MNLGQKTPRVKSYFREMNMGVLGELKIATGQKSKNCPTLLICIGLTVVSLVTIQRTLNQELSALTNSYDVHFTFSRWPSCCWLSPWCSAPLIWWVTVRLYFGSLFDVITSFWRFSLLNSLFFLDLFFLWSGLVDTTTPTTISTSSSSLLKSPPITSTRWPGCCWLSPWWSAPPMWWGDGQRRPGHLHHSRPGDRDVHLAARLVTVRLYFGSIFSVITRFWRFSLLNSLFFVDLLFLWSGLVDTTTPYPGICLWSSLSVWLLFQ